jgi:adenine-specific DNA-methyltransferase
MEKLRMTSPDLTEVNIEKIADLFPSVITETVNTEGNPKRAIDFDALRQELSDHVVEGPQERYQLDWPGKRAAAFAANAPIAKTLRPVREESVNFDTTKNLFIEGDNLDALKLLQEPYLGKVKLIYIDPPYNTGSDRFIYPDDYAETNAAYLERSGQSASDGARLVGNPETNGRFHSDWLSMMYPRLRLARNLLADDGVILVSIDDGEQANLRVLLDEVFGRRGFLAQLIWDKQHSQQQGMFKRYHEFVLAYTRTAGALEYISGGEGVIEAGALKKISKANPASEFTFPAGVRFEAAEGTTLVGTFGDSEKVTVVQGQLSCAGGRTAAPVTLSAGWTQRNQMISWFAGNETFDTRGQKVLEFFFSSTGKLKCRKERGRLTPSTFLPKYGMNSEQSERLSQLMGAVVFDNPKPVRMIEDFIEWFTDEGDVVLDFFAGSGTTAEAALRVSARSGEQRPWVLIQLDEQCGVGTPAREAGYETIAELARDRIQRASAEILGEINDAKWSEDVGFRTLRVDSTNMQDVSRAPHESGQEMLTGLIDNVKPDRTGEDLLIQVLIDWGLEPTVPIAVKEVVGKEVFVVDEGSLVACFSSEVSPELVRAIARLEPLRVVFRDLGFSSDDARINAEQIFRELSESTDMKVI